MRSKQIYTVAAITLSAFLLTGIAQAQSKDTTAKAAQTDTLLVEVAEIEASVNIQEWRSHLEKNLYSPIEKASKKGMKAGLYTVKVRFLVERDGSLSDVRALNDPGYGLADASVKVVKTGPKWTPGEQNGRKVRSYHTQPISFFIQSL